MNLLDNRISPKNKIRHMLMEVRQQLGGASTGPDNLFSCLIMLRNALQGYIDTDPAEMDGIYSSSNNLLGNARDHMERAVNKYGMFMFAPFVAAIERIGAKHHGW
jgi:hypothetical protein